MALTQVVSKETKKGPGRGRRPRFLRDVPRPNDPNVHPSSGRIADELRPPVTSRSIDTLAPPSTVVVRKPALEPTKIKQSFWRSKGKFAALVGGATAVGGGATYLHHHYSRPKETAMVKSLHNPFDGRDYEVTKGQPLVGANGPITNRRLVPTPGDPAGASHGLDLKRIRGKGTLPRQTKSLELKGGSIGPGDATGDGVHGFRVKSGHFRGKHSGAVSA